MGSHNALQFDQFITDLVAMITGDSNWGGDFGTKPPIQKTTETKVTGFIQGNQDMVTIYADKESKKVFGMGGNPPYYNKVHASIDIQTSTSEVRFNVLCVAINDILSRNVRYGNYVQIFALDFTNLSDGTRKYWRGVIDVTGEIYNPQKTLP